MTFYQISGNAVVESNTFPAQAGDVEFFAICRPNEAVALAGICGWDEATLIEYTSIDQIVCYTSHEGYDFISLIYAEMENGSVVQREVNMFFSRRYLVLVIPDNEGARLERLVAGIRKAVATAALRSAPLIYLYYVIFNSLVMDFSETLEALEDEIEALAEVIVEKNCHRHLAEIGHLRKAAYAYKKIFRAMSYVGGHILVDENQLLDDDYMRYLRSIDVRLMKQHYLAESLYDLNNELLHIYESKFSTRINETMNKLAAITLIFGPMTLIAGIYGMNFAYMPELQWSFGYPIALGFMATIGATIFTIMKKKKWL